MRPAEKDGVIMDRGSFDLQALRARMSGIGERLDGPWAEKLKEQLHLDRGTKECAYWHSGYHQALSDILSLLGSNRSSDDTSDRSSPRLAAG